MPTREQPPAGLAACVDAEDYFQLLGVDYEERALAAGRLHILRLFGRELTAAGLEAGLNAAGEVPAEELPRYRAALERAYATLLDGGPLQHRVFKVLADRAPGQFVPDTEIEISGPTPELDTAVDASPESHQDPDGGESR